MSRKTPKKQSASTQLGPAINKLEQRIDELIGLCDTLRSENRELRGKVQDVIGERDQFRKKNKLAIKKVQSVLSSVRILEKQS